MPIFEFQCQCGNKFEKLVPIGSCPDTEKCPNCGQNAQRRMSIFSWYMGWDFLKHKKSEPAPEGSGYYPKWDKWSDGSISR